MRFSVNLLNGIKVSEIPRNNDFRPNTPCKIKRTFRIYIPSTLKVNLVLNYFVYLSFFFEIVKKPGFVKSFSSPYDFDNPMIALEIFL